MSVGDGDASAASWGDAWGSDGKFFCVIVLRVEDVTRIVAMEIAEWSAEPADAGLRATDVTTEGREPDWVKEATPGPRPRYARSRGETVPVPRAVAPRWSLG
jgi:hypothetical protein